MTAKRDELLAEVAEVESALSALSGVGKTQTRRSRKATGSTSSVNRREQFIQIVGESPGITVAQAADKMGMAGPNYLYRVAGQLAEQGKLRKDGAKFFPADKAAEKAKEPDESASESADREPVAA